MELYNLQQILIDLKISLKAQNIALSSSLEYLRLKKKFYRAVKKKAVKTSLEVIKLPSAEKKSKISLDKLKYQLLELKSRLSWEGIRVGLSPKYSRLKTEFYLLGKTLGLKASLKPSSSDGFYFPNPSRAEIQKIKKQSYLRSYRDLSGQLNNLKILIKTTKLNLNSSLEYLRLKKAFYRVGQKVGLRASLNTHKLPARETILGRASHFTKSLSTSELIKYAEDFDNEATMSSVTDLSEPTPELTKYVKDFDNKATMLSVTDLSEPTPELTKCVEDFDNKGTMSLVTDLFEPTLENKQSSQEILPEESKSYPDLKAAKQESVEERLTRFRKSLKEYLGPYPYEALDCEEYSEEELFHHVKDCLGEKAFNIIYSNFSGSDPVILPEESKSYPDLKAAKQESSEELALTHFQEFIKDYVGPDVYGSSDRISMSSSSCKEDYRKELFRRIRNHLGKEAFDEIYNCFSDLPPLESLIVLPEKNKIYSSLMRKSNEKRLILFKKYLGPDLYDSFDRISRDSSSCEEDSREKLFCQIREHFGEDVFHSIFHSDLSEVILPEGWEYPALSYDNSHVLPDNKAARESLRWEANQIRRRGIRPVFGYNYDLI